MSRCHHLSVVTPTSRPIMKRFALLGCVYIAAVHAIRTSRRIQHVHSPSDLAAAASKQEAVHWAVAALATNGTWVPVARRDCSMFAGLISVKVSPTCCYTVNIVSQRTLHSFGMAHKCPAAWDCGHDGLVPTAEFERKAVEAMCREPSCVSSTVDAMHQNWMAKQGAQQLGSICQSTLTKGRITEFHGTNLRGLRNKTGVHNDTLNKTAKRLERAKGETWSSGRCQRCKERVLYAAEKLKRVDKQLDDHTDDAYCNVTDGITGKPVGTNRHHQCFRACCQGHEDHDHACFPGQAQVTTPLGRVDLFDVKVGHKLLVEVAPGQLEFSPVLTFIHRLPADLEQNYIEVRHRGGVFRASGTHIVFVCPLEPTGRRADKFVIDLKPGEFLCAVDDDMVSPSEVLHIARRRGDGRGMFAPLTDAGTIVVDGVIASNYATPSRSVPLTHGTAHRTLLPLRTYYTSGLSEWLAPAWSAVCHLFAWEKACATNGDLELHPFVSVLHKELGLERLVTKIRYLQLGPR
eukprot:gnl/TRDRNA2_/TRDRNA2_31041_c0_seq1.p1 gnl/TRDRNA2_/TRDRNA2_31041_c0~~gnl/TRDRNA2_/TRDRNA2_31041_c0_seq1.p1  ORF type:complete len:518 (-),score=53.81 gnl/TRDRNA2_/TRDRNA2_31041_c0_seq1:38-1591(-)